MNILFVTSMHPTARFPRRGVVVLRLASALRERGHRVDVLELGDSGGPLRVLAAGAGVVAACSSRGHSGKRGSDWASAWTTGSFCSPTTHHKPRRGSG